MAIKVKDAARALKALRYLSGKNKICIRNSKGSCEVVFQSYSESMNGHTRIYVDGQVDLKDYEVVGNEIVNLINPSTMNGYIGMHVDDMMDKGSEVKIPQLIIDHALSSYPLDTWPNHQVDFSSLLEYKIARFKVKTCDFVKLLNLATSTKIRKGIRYDLSYVEFNLDDNILYCVSTDGRTFTKTSCNTFNQDIKQKLKFYIKLPTLKKIIYMFDKYKKYTQENIDIIFYINDFLTIDASCFNINIKVCSESEIKYPEYEKVLSEYVDKPYSMATINRALLLKHLRRVTTWMQNKYNTKTIVMKVTKDWIDFISENNRFFKSYLEIEGDINTSYIIDPILLENIISKRQTENIQIFFRCDDETYEDGFAKTPFVMSDNIQDKFQEFSLMLPFSRIN